MQGANKAAKTTITMPGNDEIGKGFAKTYVDDYEKAASGIKAMNSVVVARDRVNKGIIAGSQLSPLELEGRKALASIFGIPDEEAQNTDEFMSSMKTVVMDQVKALGSGNSITNTDRDYVAQAVGAANTMNPESIGRILNIIEKGNRNAIIQYNASIEKLKETNPQGAALARTIPVPEFSDSYLEQIPPRAIEILRENPDAKTIAKFDEHFGLGLAQKYLGSK